MKAVAISVRIADFLKQFPPFQFMTMKELVELSEKAKVKFHEDGERVFQQGQARDRWLYVVQQGKLVLLEQLDGKEIMVDIRGPGDIIGLQGIRSDEPYQNSILTETETILYALPRSEFVQITEKNPKARRYLAAYFSLNPVFQNEELDDRRDQSATLRKGGLYEVEAPQAIARANLMCVGPDEPVRKVGQLLQNKRIPCVLITNEDGKAIGKLTDADLRDRVIEQKIDPDARVSSIMFSDLVAVSKKASTADMLLKLTREGKNFLVVTEDGSLDSPAYGLVSERNLFLQYGRFPTVLGGAIDSAVSISELRQLRDRIEALVLEFLDSRHALTWLMDMVGILNRKLFRRIIELTEVEMENSGWGRAPVDYEWLMMGSGGRDELLIRSAVYHALVYADVDGADRVDVIRFFRELTRLVAQGIRYCGFLESEQGVLAQSHGWCLPISEMEKRFREMIEDPERFHVYSSRDAFDFRGVREAESHLARRLRETICEAIRQNADFIRWMARDSLFNQPPRTIFQGYVVDSSGAQKKDLAIKFHALLPLVDIARVLQLEQACLSETSTYKRLRIAAAALKAENPSNELLLLELSEAFLVAHYARVSQGLATGTDGAVIRPEKLSPEVRTLLITSFRTILSGLEFVGSRFDLKMRI